MTKRKIGPPKWFRHYQTVDPADRFDKFVTPGDDCWEWRGSRRANGYGQFWYDNRQGSAHRFAYERDHGPIPDGMFVLHHCDNPPCVRPDHLFLGTPLDNMRDMAAKGRTRIVRRAPRPPCEHGRGYIEGPLGCPPCKAALDSAYGKRRRAEKRAARRAA